MHCIGRKLDKTIIGRSAGNQLARFLNTLFVMFQLISALKVWHNLCFINYAEVIRGTGPDFLTPKGKL